MTKRILLLTLICTSYFSNMNAQRYLTEIFTNPQLKIYSNIVYASNYSFLTGAPMLTDLYMDIYTPDPSIDPVIKPVVIYLPTGSFLPAVVNGTPTGTKTDSAAVEMCKQFARRGYVAIAMGYRLGWNPVSTIQDVRTGTLLNAVYRSIQDAKACVRYVHSTVSNGNPFFIDTNAVILGGQGSGGYLAMAYVTLDKPAEINLTKFLSNTTQPAPYNYVQGQSFVNMASSGDFDGHGGLANENNDNNSNGFSTKVHFAFNMGGALGDSSWLESGDEPMVAFHVVGDPFAPFGDGPVIVPTTGQFVVNVSGSRSVITKANALGNNNCFINAGFTDPYTLRANQVNLGQDGLFPFDMVPATQAGPWEWFDLQATRDYAVALGYPPSEGDSVYLHALYTNPNMSKAKGLAYIDTIQNYVNPRIVYCLGLSTGINENSAVANSLIATPNPAATDITIELKQKENMIVSVELRDITGRLITFKDGLNSSVYKLERKGVAPGIYLARVNTIKGFATIRIVFN